MLKIMGKSQASIEQVRAYIKKMNPKVSDSVIKMIPLYITEGAAEGVRGDIAFAQSCLETGNFTFSGSAVTLSQNNFCGLGVTKTGMRGNSFKTPAEGIRAQIQHLQAYASTDRLKNRCVDPRYTYVNRGCAEYVEYLGIQENPKGQGWASGNNYGQKIINILNDILSIKASKKALKTEKESVTMNIIKMISKKNCYIGQNKPAYIVIHETDNWSKGADAKAHATAMKNGNLAGNVHYYVDSKSVYQTLDHNDGAWAVGDGKGKYGITNRNSINIEICVNPETDYYKAVDKAEQLAAQLLKQQPVHHKIPEASVRICAFHPDSLHQLETVRMVLHPDAVYRKLSLNRFRLSLTTSRHRPLQAALAGIRRIPVFCPDPDKAAGAFPAAVQDSPKKCNPAMSGSICAACQFLPDFPGE